MRDKPDGVWVLVCSELIPPGQCPSCGAATEVEPEDYDAYSLAWTTCEDCMATAARRKRAGRILGGVVLLAIAILGGAVALQFMDTGIPDNTLLMTGMAASASSGLIGGLGVAAWLIHADRARLFLRIPGVRIGRIESELGLPDDIVELRFTRPQYRSAILDANPGTCESRFESILAAARFKSDSGEAEPGGGDRTVSKPGDHETYAWKATVHLGLMLVGFSILVLWFLWNGAPSPKQLENRGWLTPLLTAAALSSIGVVLRIEAARLIAFAVTLVLLAVTVSMLAGDILHPPRKSRIEKLVLGPFLLGLYAWALTAAPTRRLCSRWGRLGRLFPWKRAR